MWRLMLLAMLVLPACAPATLAAQTFTAGQMPAKPPGNPVAILMDKFAVAEANGLPAQELASLESNDPSRSTIACIYGKVMRHVDQPTQTRLFLSGDPYPLHIRLPAGVAVHEGDCIKATGIIWLDNGRTPFIAPGALQDCN